MKHIHIPTFIIFGISIFCISTSHLDLANAIQYCWTGFFAILICTYNLLKICYGKSIELPKDKIFKTICILGIFEILYAIIQLFGVVPDNFHYAYFSGSLNNPAIFGMLLSFCIPICVYFAIQSVNKTRVFWRTMVFIFGVFIILSNSRTAILSSVCGIAVILTMEQKFLYRFISNTQYRNIGILCIIIALISLYFYKKDSADGRLLIWTVCIEMLKDKPWFGWGFDEYIAQYMNYQANYLIAHPNSPFAQLAGETQNPFNEFLHVALILGIPCALVFIGIIVWSIWYIIRKVKDHKSILLSYVYVLIVWCLFCYPFNIPFIWLIIIFIGLSFLQNTNHLPYSKLCMFLVLATSIWGLYTLGFTTTRNIRRLCLQEYSSDYTSDEVMEKYEKMYKDYSNDYLFIYNYGALLHLNGDYKKSLEVLQHGTNYLSDYNMMLLMGDDYQNLAQYDQAIACYKRANEMIPNRYLPLYYQMKLHIENGDINEGHRLANIIIKKKRKVKKSRITQQIINEAKTLLNN